MVLAGTPPGMQHGGIHLGPQSLGGERDFAPLEKTTAVGFTGLEHVDATTQAGFRHAQGRRQCDDFLPRFAPALWKKRLIGDRDGQPLVTKFFQQAGGKLFRNEKRFESVLVGNSDDDGGGGMILGQRRDKFTESMHLRDACAWPGAVNFQRREDDVGFTARLPPDEGIVGIEVGGVEHVGIVAAGGAHQAG